jgi:hypothetical protein
MNSFGKQHDTKCLSYVSVYWRSHSQKGKADLLFKTLHLSHQTSLSKGVPNTEHNMISKLQEVNEVFAHEMITWQAISRPDRHAAPMVPMTNNN